MTDDEQEAQTKRLAYFVHKTRHVSPAGARQIIKDWSDMQIRATLRVIDRMEARHSD